MLKVLTVACLIGLSQGALAQQCDHRITFLPQTHALDSLVGLDERSENLNEVANSQLKVAQYLGRFPKRAVFSEQMTTTDIKWLEIPAEKRAGLKNLMKSIFPYGLPESATLLTQIQKEKLGNNGGEFIQLMRGHLSSVYKVVGSKQELEKIMRPLENWFKTSPDLSRGYPTPIRKLIYEARERAALLEIRKYFALHPDEKNAVLIFGANHNFQFYADLFPPECITTPPEFQNDWLGRFRVSSTSFAGQEQFQPYSFSHPSSQ